MGFTVEGATIYTNLSNGDPWNLYDLKSEEDFVPVEDVDWNVITDNIPEENTRLHGEYCEWGMENVEPAVRFWSVLGDNYER